MNAEDFLTILTDELNILIEKRAEQLIERAPEEYNPCKSSFGHYHNGVGWASYGEEVEYNNDLAREDAKNEIAQDIANSGADFGYYQELFCENNKLTSALAMFIKSL
jgi:hypothetical protein